MGRMKESTYEKLEQHAKEVLRRQWAEDYPEDNALLQVCLEDNDLCGAEQFEEQREEYVEDSLEDCMSDLMEAEYAETNPHEYHGVRRSDF